jgi:hypothetical protein
MQKKWANPAVLSFLCGLIGWLILLSEAWVQISGLNKSTVPGTINRLNIIYFILVCSLAILLGIRGNRQIKLNQELSGKVFALLGVLLAALALIVGPIFIIILFNHYNLKLVIG